MITDHIMIEYTSRCHNKLKLHFFFLQLGIFCNFFYQMDTKIDFVRQHFKMSFLATVMAICLFVLHVIINPLY
jgi:hypothetical protein